MKPVAPILCLFAALTTVSARPVVPDEAIAAAPRLREVRFEGDLAFDPDTLKAVLEALEIRRVIPGIWTLRPAYDARAVAADLLRLRSFYVSHGYFDARIGLGNVVVHRGDATVTLDVQSGPEYAVRRIAVEGMPRGHGEVAADSTDRSPLGALCNRLLDARHIAELQGRLDFAAGLEVSDANESTALETGRPSVNVTARVRMGSPYTLGRIDFSGHHKINDSTLRRAMALQERSLLDIEKLRSSLARLNRSGLFDPLGLADVDIQRNPETLTANLTVPIRERRGRWSLTGPLGPAALFGPLQAAVSSRLPAWGRGPFEASTYLLTFSLTGLSNPLVRLLPIGLKPSPPALLVVERPYLPGQALFSGFALSPQLSARGVLASYGRTHLDRAVQALVGEPRDAPALVVPVVRTGGRADSEDVRTLICRPPEPSHPRLRHAAALAADLALGVFRPF